MRREYPPLLLPPQRGMVAIVWLGADQDATWVAQTTAGPTRAVIGPKRLWGSDPLGLPIARTKIDHFAQVASIFLRRNTIGNASVFGVELVSCKPIFLLVPRTKVADT